jgi:hypothetical protein
MRKVSSFNLPPKKLLQKYTSTAGGHMFHVRLEAPNGNARSGGDTTDIVIIVGWREVCSIHIYKSVKGFSLVHNKSIILAAYVLTQ